jgi:MFS family permease
MLLNISPLKKYREFRLLYLGQLISFLGSMISYVAIPYQVYELTKNNAIVGLISIAQLVPVLIFGILGGTYADRLNRRRLLLVCETLMCFFVALLAWNAWREYPSVIFMFVVVALMQAVLGFHRPAMEALTQVVVDKKDYGAIGALGSFRYSFGAIGGPALAGIVIAGFGVKGAFLLDICTYFVALTCLTLMKPLTTPEKSQKSPWRDAVEGMHFAISKPELIGTYVIDIVAMVFAFPVALFPAMSENWGGAKAAGILFSAMAIGSLAMTLVSGWTSNVKHHGRGVVISAAFWGVFMIGVGFSHDLWLSVVFLALAGGADMLSGLFRGVIWNETVPNNLRGRLSGIEMISYMTGPLLGNARAGWIAAHFSIAASLASGGIVCLIAVVVTAACLPSFWRYRSQTLTA